jgi:hypothetical protein
MNPKRLQLAEATDHAAWDAWVEQSPQGTVFSKLAFLRSLKTPFRLFAVENAGRPVALVPTIESKAGNPMRFPFTPYQGILFLPDPQSGRRQQILNEFRITEFVVSQLTERYREIAMTLSWNFQDIRPFLWHNYGAVGGHFDAQPRYTAVLELDSIESAAYASHVRASRRQELKKAAGYSIKTETQLDDFLRLYSGTFSRQGIAVDDARLALVGNISRHALLHGYGRLSSCSTESGIAAMSLFLYDSRRAYYLFAANDPTQRDSGASTRLMFDNILEAKRRGLQELDFVGVNSPARGDFKLSFNPQLKLYFELSYPRSSLCPAAT